MKRFVSFFISSCFVLAWVTNVSAIPFEFYGISSGGVGSAEMNIELTAPTAPTAPFTMLVTIDNTSPIYQLDGTSLNNPSITAFGFDLYNSPNLLSWELWTTDRTDNSPVFVGDMSDTSNWEMDTFVSSISLDYLPQTTHGSNFGIYNPLTLSIGANPLYSAAYLTLTFDSEPVLDQLSPFVRMQEVGNGGSLKLTPVPEPASMILLGVCLTTYASFRLRKKKK